MAMVKLFFEGPLQKYLQEDRARLTVRLFSLIATWPW